MGPHPDESDDRGLRMAFAVVTLYHQRRYLDEAVAWLRSHGYYIVELVCRGWTSEAAFHRDIAAAFAFPDYYGGNMGAFDDCLYDVAVRSYGTDPEATGTVLVLTEYDVFAEHEPEVAYYVLDIFAGQARGAALLGHRMLCLVQSDDPRLHFEPVGATPVMWNRKERLGSQRGL